MKIRKVIKAASARCPKGSKWDSLDLPEQLLLMKKFTRRYHGTKIFEDFADYIGKDVEDIIDLFADFEDRGHLHIPQNKQSDSAYCQEDIYSADDSAEVDENSDELPQVDQEYDSAKTSINSTKLPAIYKMISLPAGSVGVDYGGGKFDNAVEALAQDNVTLYVYDPYNRSREHNSQVVKSLRANGGADFAINSNVLNVIKEPEARRNVLENIKKITKSGAPIYITVYEGSGNNNEGVTKSGYQLNRKTSDYLDEIREVFPDAKRKGKLIVATNSGSVNSATAIMGDDEPWGAEELHQQIQYEVRQFMKNQLGFDENEVDSYSRVDATFSDGSLVIEVGCEAGYEALEALCNQLDPIVQECDPDAYFEPEQPGIITAWLSTNNVECATEVNTGSDECWIDKYFDRVDAKFICDNAGYEPEDLISADDLAGYDGDHIAWLVPKPEYEYVLGNFSILELLEEDGELFISETSHDQIYDITPEIQEAINGIQAATTIEAGYYDYPEPNLDPPEDDDYIQVDADEEIVELHIDTNIRVDEDGQWEYESEDWATPYAENDFDVYSDQFSDILLTDRYSTIETVDDLIVDDIPEEPGRYHLVADIELHYNIEGVTSKITDAWFSERDGFEYDEEVYTDAAEVELNKDTTKVNKIEISKVDVNSATKIADAKADPEEFEKQLESVTASGNDEYGERYKIRDKKYKHNYSVRYDKISPAGDEDEGLEVFKAFKGTISTLAPYDDADYAWATFSYGRIVIRVGTKVVENIYYNDPDTDCMSNSEWYDSIITTAIEIMEEINAGIEPRMMYN